MALIDLLFGITMSVGILVGIAVVLVGADAENRFVLHKTIIQSLLPRNNQLQKEKERMEKG